MSVGLPTHRVDWPEMMTGEAVARLARQAESSGFDAVFVTDHPFPGDAWLASGGHHALDPMVALAFAASATTRLRLQTNLYILAYRNPFISAKAAATLDVLSGGRLILGVGAGYLEEEFAALGADFGRRNQVTDEAISALKEAWKGRSVRRSGLGFNAAGNTMLPVPNQHPHPPIWVGGNSLRAIRRAAELGDGWVPMPNPARGARRRRTPPLETLEDLGRRLAFLRQACEEAGRSRSLEVVFMPEGTDMFSSRGVEAARLVESAAELRRLGVSYLAMTLPARSVSEFSDRLGQLGEQALAQIARL